MSNEIIVFANQDDTVIVKVRRAPPMAPFDARLHQESLNTHRRFVQAHAREIGYLLGKKPEDQDSFLMTTEGELPDLIKALRQTRMRPEEIISLTAQVLRSSPNWNQPDEVAGDMGQALVNLLAQVAQGIPKK